MKKLLLSILFVLLVVMGALAYLQLPPFSHGLGGNAMIVSDSPSRQQLVDSGVPAVIHKPTANTNYLATPTPSGVSAATPSSGVFNTPRAVPVNSFSRLPPTVAPTASFGVARSNVVSKTATLVPQNGVVVKTSFSGQSNTQSFAPLKAAVQQGSFSSPSRPINPNAATQTQLSNGKQGNFAEAMRSPVSRQQVNTKMPNRFGAPPSQFPNIATNLQTLVRAQYKLPNEAAKKLEELFAFRGNEKVETTILDLKHPKLILLQVTTDSATQKAIAQFLDTIYSTARIEEIESSTTLPKVLEEDTAGTDTEKVSLRLPSMTCGGCAIAVRAALSSIGATEIETNSKDQTCSFLLADVSDIEQAIDKLAKSTKHMNDWSFDDQ